MCSTNEHLSTLKPEKLLPLLTQAVPELDPPAPFPQEHAINGQHTSWYSVQGLDFTNQWPAPGWGWGRAAPECDHR